MTMFNDIEAELEIFKKYVIFFFNSIISRVYYAEIQDKLTCNSDGK